MSELAHCDDEALGEPAAAGEDECTVVLGVEGASEGLAHGDERRGFLVDGPVAHEQQHLAAGLGEAAEP